MQSLFFHTSLSFLDIMTDLRIRNYSALLAPSFIAEEFPLVILAAYNGLV